MKLLITGGGGFIGARLARALLQSGELGGRRIEHLVLTDQVAPPADLAADRRVETRIGPLLALCATLPRERLDGVFHLASAVSGECEADFELGLRSNLDSTRALLDGLRAATTAGAPPPRLVFSSSVAVFGPDPSVPLPERVGDDTLPAPKTSYGTHKLMCEHLIADYSRKGFVDGRSARLMTVTVRPGRPNGAASSFFSGIVREPLAGIEAICPVAPEVSHPLTSAARTVEGLIAVYEASLDQLGGRLALNLPAVNVTIAEMLDALEAVAGAEVRRRVRFVRDETIAGIVANWPRGATAGRAARLGLRPDADFGAIIRQYIAECAAAPERADALKGLPPQAVPIAGAQP
jgi:nucleoside-diphosphate-sugar epimerase